MTTNKKCWQLQIWNITNMCRKLYLCRRKILKYMGASQDQKLKKTRDNQLKKKMKMMLWNVRKRNTFFQLQMRLRLQKHQRRGWHLIQLMKHNALWMHMDNYLVLLLSKEEIIKIRRLLLFATAFENLLIQQIQQGRGRDMEYQDLGAKWEWQSASLLENGKWRL